MLKLNRLLAVTGAAFTMGTIISSGAQASGTVSPNNSQGSFNAVGESIINGISSLPGLLTGLSYMMGLLFSVLGVLKIKDHVENPTQTQLKEGAIRLAAGGALFLIPVVTTAMQDLISTGAGPIEASTLNAVTFKTNGGTTP